MMATAHAPPMAEKKDGDDRKGGQPHAIVDIGGAQPEDDDGRRRGGRTRGCQEDAQLQAPEGADQFAQAGAVSAAERTRDGGMPSRADWTTKIPESPSAMQPPILPGDRYAALVGRCLHAGRSGAWRCWCGMVAQRRNGQLRRPTKKCRGADEPGRAGRPSPWW